MLGGHRVREVRARFTTWRFAALVPLASLAFVLPSAAQWAAPARDARGPGDRIVGTATSRERVALGRSAVFEAVLEDVSRAAAPPEVVARVRTEGPGQVPIAFEIPYDPRRIDPRRQYVVRASLRDGELHFASERPVPVAMNGPAPRITIVMRRTSGPGVPERGRREVAPGLAHTRWRPVRIGNRPVVLSGRQGEPWIELDARSHQVTGSGGCNPISGRYESGERTLRFEALSATKRGCASMDVERAFLRTLNATRGYRIRGRNLYLIDRHEAVLARLEERDLR